MYFFLTSISIVVFLCIECNKVIIVILNSVYRTQKSNLSTLQYRTGNCVLWTKLLAQLNTVLFMLCCSSLHAIDTYENL